jgi:hypothetical protein
MNYWKRQAERRLCLSFLQSLLKKRICVVASPLPAGTALDHPWSPQYQAIHGQAHGLRGVRTSVSKRAFSLNVQTQYAYARMLAAPSSCIFLSRL